MKTPLAQGVVYSHYQSDIKRLGRKVARATSDDSDSWRDWVYFYGATLNEVHEWLRVNGWDEVRIDSPHDCTGRTFRRSPCVDQVGKRILVTQSGGYDI